MSVLRKRTLRCKDPKVLRDYPALRGFYDPQRDHVAQPMPERAR